MLALDFNGELSGLTEFGITDTEAAPYFFTFKVECSACRELHPNAIGFNAYETHSLAGSRGEANFAMKCKSCGKEGNINVDTKKFGLFNTEKNDAKKPARFATFDCRGLNLVEFIPDGDFWASAESGSKFSVKFEDGEFYDYDEKANEEVSITGCEWKIVKTK